ncbi:MAG TPA: hypothetical protein VHA11_00200 [Bryobacteraceae bacterium]|nr:hypothetical protein [Bryobacteraceae bacterium]
MISELLIAALVLILGGYWFRYNCLSILKTKVSLERARHVATANDLSFPAVQARLASLPDAAELGTLNQALLRDYEVLTCLLRYTSPTAYTVEQRMLILDFRFMQLRFAIGRRYLQRLARRSLDECARILIHFASTMGDRGASVLRA